MGGFVDVKKLEISVNLFLVSFFIFSRSVDKDILHAVDKLLIQSQRF